MRQPTIVMAKAQLDLLVPRRASKQSAITSTWSPGLRAPLPGEQNAIDIVADAATLTGMRVIVAVFHTDCTTTPLTDGDRDEFAAYAAAIARDNPTIRDFVIGNEPNLNRFWMPQFGLDGASWRRVRVPGAARPDLRRAEEGVSDEIQVIGGAVSPRGGDRPGGIRPTHSPTTFITDLGNAYRAERPDSCRSWTASRSTRTRTTRATPPGFAHPQQHDDRDRRLRQARHAARPGVRRHRPAGLDAADLLRRVRRRDGDPRREVAPCTPARSRPR